MKDVEVVHLEEHALQNPTLVEGLPGVGYVGKLTVEHMIAELNAKLFCRIYSRHFPPQALINEDGTAYLVNNEFYAWQSPEGKSDLILLMGDHQSITNDGHYIIADHVLDLAEEWKVGRIITLGGFATGKIVDEPGVIGVPNNLEMLEYLSGMSIDSKMEEPGGGIIGISGLLLGMARIRGIPAVCMMSETSGYMVDPKSARVLLSTLCRVLGIEVSLEELNRRAEEMEQFVARLASAQRSEADREYADENRYIG